MKNKAKGFFTVDQVAKQFGRSSSFIRFLVYRGKIPSYLIGGHTMFRVADLDYIEYFFKYIQTNKHGKKRLGETGGTTI